MKTVWILRDDDYYGENILAVYSEKPNANELMELQGFDEEEARRLLVYGEYADFTLSEFTVTESPKG